MQRVHTIYFYQFLHLFSLHGLVAVLALSLSPVLPGLQVPLLPVETVHLSAVSECEVHDGLFKSSRKDPFDAKLVCMASNS